MHRRPRHVDGQRESIDPGRTHRSQSLPRVPSPIASRKGNVYVDRQQDPPLRLFPIPFGNAYCRSIVTFITSNLHADGRWGVSGPKSKIESHTHTRAQKKKDLQKKVINRAQASTGCCVQPKLRPSINPSFFWSCNFAWITSSTPT